MNTLAATKSVPVARCRYVVVTPARNEAENIERTIKSMVAQSWRPVKWVVVSDGSTDGTNDIVQRYAQVHSWIELVRLEDRKDRNFAGKVGAFNAGFGRVKDVSYDVIGNMDADISFDGEYFNFLMERFAENPGLGVGGTPFREEGEGYDFRYSSTDHVSGACQMFRRECFEAIGGYVPVKGGGIDVIAVLTARMKGWQTRTFTETSYEHHRKMGSAKHGAVTIRFKDGEKDYYLGGHPFWELFRFVYQMTKPPFIIGGCALLAGYVWSWVRGVERPISNELMQFRRRDQMRRLRHLVTRQKSSPETRASHDSGGKGCGSLS